MNTDANDRVTANKEDFKTGDRAAFAPQLFALSTESPAAAPEGGLALGVLRQAAHDLRKFNSATRGVEREFYLDAYSWIMADDFFWPYSFLNVCESLHVSPEAIRAELLADASLGRFGHWIKVRERLTRLLRAPLFAFLRCLVPPRIPEIPAIVPGLVFGSSLSSRDASSWTSKAAARASNAATYGRSKPVSGL